jgi:CelD/BcsL family acetyltransferase involved in cellulose biosynthesis
MVITVVPADELTPDQIAAWNALQRSQPGLESPFFRPEFTQIVASARPDASVAVIDDGSVSVGFFPFQRARRSGLPIGGRLSDYHGLVARSHTTVHPKELLKACRLTRWEFDGLVMGQPWFAPFHRRFRSSYVLDLSGGLDGYAAQRRAAGSDAVKDIRAQARRLERELGPLRFQASVDDARMLELLIAWKSEQYRRTGAVDVFAFRWALDVVRRAYAESSNDFAGELSALYVDGEAVALHLGLRAGSVLHSWFPAYDVAHARYSPGLVLLLHLVEGAAAMGIGTIDLGKGDAPYKRRLANGTVALAVGTVEVSPLRAAAANAARLVNGAAHRTPLGRRMDLAAARRRFR